MKTLFSIVAMSISVATGQAAEIDKANISNDAKFVVHLDLDAFRASKIGTTILEKIRESEGGGKFNALVELIEFDPLSAIHGATMFGNGEEDNGILVVKHKANSAKLLAFMKLNEHYRKTEHGKHEIHGAGDRSDGERGYISFVNKSTAVLAPNRELTGVGIDLINGKGGAIKVPSSLDSMSKKTKNAFLVAYANVENLKENIDNETVNQMVKRAALSLGESDEKFILSISVDALDADAAENMENMINGLIGFARLNQDENPEVKDILKGLKTTRNEEKVSVHFSIGVDKLFELIDPALKEIDIDLPKL